MYKGVIFDLDGTLVNSIEDIKNSLNRILKKYNHPEKSLEDYTRNIGQGLRQLTIDSLSEGEKTKHFEEIFKEFLNDYSNNYLVDTKPYAEIIDLVSTLHKSGVKLGVNSNKQDEFTKDIVKTLFPNIPFALVLGDRVNVVKKPNPESALEIIEKMNLSKSDVVYVGDTDHDIKTAINANIDSIGVTWGYRTKDQLVEAKASHIASTVSELKELILL